MSGRLAHFPSDVIRHLLIQRGLGTLPSVLGLWPISATKEADGPDNTITVKDTTPKTQGRDQISGEVWKRHAVQIAIRGTSPVVAYAKASDILFAIEQEIYLDTVSIGASRYLVQSMAPENDVLSLGTEEASSRDVFVINATISLRQVA